MKQIAEHIWVAPWPELLSKTIPGRFDLTLQIGDRPCDTLDLNKAGGVLRHMWIPVMSTGRLDYSSFFAVNRILDAYRGKHILVYAREEDGMVPLSVWSWVVREGLSETALHNSPDEREAMEREWAQAIEESESGQGRFPAMLMEFLQAMKDHPESGIQTILETEFEDIAQSLNEETEEEPEGEALEEEEAEEDDGEEQEQGDNYLFTHAHPFGVNVGLVNSPLNLVELVHGRAHHQSRVAMARILGIDYEPRKGERLEITGPWVSSARFCSQDIWDDAYAESEAKHRVREESSGPCSCDEEPVASSSEELNDQDT